MDNTDRFIGIAGLLLAIPGIISLFYNDHIVVGILVSILMLMLWLFWYHLNKHAFKIIRVEKTLTLHDDKGDKASLERRQKTRVIHKGLTEFWCRNISADGPITNILIDGEPPFQIKKEAGDTHVCIRFSRPKKAGEEFELVLTYDMENAFQSKTENLIHNVEAETKYLKLVVDLPGSRKIKESRSTLRFGGNPHQELASPLVSGQKIEIEIKRPRLGAEYCLEWDW